MTLRVQVGVADLDGVMELKSLIFELYWLTHCI